MQFVLQSGRALNEKEFCKYFEKKVFRTIRNFFSFEKKDKIAVACSGGKDSITCLYILNKFCKERKQKIEAIIIDEGIKGYRDELIKKLKVFCKKQGIKLNVFSFKREFGFEMQKITKEISAGKMGNCYVCSILKRWLLNKKAKLLGVDVIATGHSLDDEAETILLNQLKGNAQLLAKLGPVVGIKKRKDFVQRVKPLYFCSEKEIVHYARINKLPLSLEVCPLRGKSFRVEIRNFLNRIEKKHSEAKNAIVNSFLSIVPSIKERFKNSEMKKCSCGEPSSQQECKACQILRILKKLKNK